MQQYCTHLQFNQWSKSYPYTFHDGENFDLAQVKLDYIPQQQIKKWNFLYSFPKTLWNTTYKHRNRGRLLRKRQNVCQKAYLSSWRNKSLKSLNFSFSYAKQYCSTRQKGEVWDTPISIPEQEEKPQRKWRWGYAQPFTRSNQLHQIMDFKIS